MNSKDLDAQCTVKIERWIDPRSDEAQSMFDDLKLTEKFLRIGFQDPAFMIVDEKGRVWTRASESGKYYPFHDQFGDKNYGYRLPEKAAN